MKFLCVPCDEPMKLQEARGPDEGSMTVLFGCPTCGHEVAMLTNQMETQLVRTLGVKIGGRTEAAQPMEMVRGHLAHQRDVAPSHEAEVPAQPAAASGSKCPFTGVVAEAYAQPAGPSWTPEAEARIARIPPYARPMVQRGVEQYARDQGYAEINDQVMDEVKGQFGM